MNGARSAIINTNWNNAALALLPSCDPSVALYYSRLKQSRMLRSFLADWDAGKVSESASTSRLLENLLPGHNYSIFVSAQTRAGRGPFSRDAWVFCSTRDEGTFTMLMVGLGLHCTSFFGTVYCV